jgi:hypothetical protein
MKIDEYEVDKKEGNESQIGEQIEIQVQINEIEEDKSKKKKKNKTRKIYSGSVTKHLFTLLHSPST